MIDLLQLKLFFQLLEYQKYVYAPTWNILCTSNEEYVKFSLF